MYILYSKINNEKLKIKNYTRREFIKYYNSDLYKLFPEYNPAFHIISKINYEYPVIVNNEIREMTLYERYQNGLYELKGNEYIENEEIKIKVYIPSRKEVIESELKNIENEIELIGEKLASRQISGFPPNNLQIKLNELILKHYNLCYELSSL